MTEIDLTKNGEKKIYDYGTRYELPDGSLHRLDGPAVIVGRDYRAWYFNDEYHREDGPAIIERGEETWYRHGILHRVDGPAITFRSGEQEWYYEGKLHRTNGPAAIYNGEIAWYKHGVLHRTNGPALMRDNGVREYWINGNRQRKLPAPRWVNPEQDKREINEFLESVEKEDGLYVFWKGTRNNGMSPVSYPKCGCNDVFDYQIGYEYTEPHCDFDFDNDCGAGINVCASLEEAKRFGEGRVVKVLVAKKDIVYASDIKWRVKKVIVVEELFP